MPSPLESPDTGLLLSQVKDPVLVQEVVGLLKAVPLLVNVKVRETNLPSLAWPPL